jgi:hypothetical protein
MADQRADLCFRLGTRSIKSPSNAVTMKASGMSAFMRIALPRLTSVRSSLDTSASAGKPRLIAAFGLVRSRIPRVWAAAARKSARPASPCTPRKVSFTADLTGYRLHRPSVDYSVLEWAFWSLNLTAAQAGPLTAFIASFSSPEGLFWAKLSAASTLAVVPILIFGWITQRRLVRGLTFGTSDSRCVLTTTGHKSNSRA